MLLLFVVVVMWDMAATRKAPKANKAYSAYLIQYHSYRVCVCDM
jgi:hypothetical protein